MYSSDINILNENFLFRIKPKRKRPINNEKRLKEVR